eukprot:2063840-Alexandrium_andersonii.AAC.1
MSTLLRRASTATLMLESAAQPAHAPSRRIWARSTVTTRRAAPPRMNAMRRGVTAGSRARLNADRPCSGATSAT